MSRIWTCQLCEKEYRYKEGKLKLCPSCASKAMLKEARRIWFHNDWAETFHRPATLSLRQWIATLNYFEWKCAYCQQRPYEILEHFIPFELEEAEKQLCTLIGGTTIYNCIPSCYKCNGRKGRHSPEYIWKTALIDK